jgi:hypothetical protein
MRLFQHEPLVQFLQGDSMMRRLMMAACLGLVCLHAQAGLVDPDCTAEKAVKSAAMKATVGVGGRCDPKEAAADTMGLDDKKDAVEDAKDSVSDTKDKVDDATDNVGRKALKKAVN